MTVIEPAQEGGYRAAGTGWELLLDRPETGLFTFRAGKNLEIVLHGAKLDDLEESTALAGCAWEQADSRNRSRQKLRESR